MPSLHRTPAATAAATGPVSSNTRRRRRRLGRRRLGRPASGRESKDPFTSSDRVRPSVRPSVRGIRGRSRGRVREVVAKVFPESLRRSMEGSNVDLGHRRRLPRGRRPLRHHQGEAQIHTHKITVNSSGFTPILPVALSFGNRKKDKFSNCDVTY